MIRRLATGRICTEFVQCCSNGHITAAQLIQSTYRLQRTPGALLGAYTGRHRDVVVWLGHHRELTSFVPPYEVAHVARMAKDEGDIPTSTWLVTRIQDDCLSLE